jgi:tetratricopeptide (TPR) repeat protein
LREVAEEHSIALLFDTYERTGDFLDPWLRALLEGRHGDVPANILLVIAGRDELDHNHWAPYEGLVARLFLEPFAEEDARDYLARKGITDERVVEVILGLSGRLPLLVATLAAEIPDDPEKVGDPSGEAVERFLKWVEDPKQRQVALDAALPRRLNRDVLAVLVGEEEANALFVWFRGMPFVEKRGDGWAYHEVVRAQMLRYKRQEAPKGWADLHGRLAEYYEYLRDGLGLEEEAGRKDEAWQRYALEVLYHRLCQAPQAQLAATLNRFLAALKAQRAFARRWAGVVNDAGEDAEASSVQAWGQRLLESLKSYEADRYQEASEMFTALLEQADLEAQWRAAALDWRGYLYYLADQHAKALTDLAEAIQLAPEEAEYRAARGATYRLMERYDEALADFNRAIELEPDDAWDIASRGETYQLMGRYDEALADFDRAIELKPDHAWAIASRGLTYRLMERYEEALADFDRAIELVEPGVAWYLAHRGETYWEMERYEEALADFNRAIDLEPDSAWAIASRGQVYRALERYQEALADLNQAIELDLKLIWAVAERGETYREMERYKEALADFNRAIDLRPGVAWDLAHRGETYRLMERYEEALADFDRAIGLDPDDAWAIAHRGDIYRLMEQYEEALADFDRAIELETDGDWYLYDRALAYRALGQTEQAQADLTAAIQRALEMYEKEPQDWQNRFNLALYNLAIGEAEEAERLYREALSGGASPHRISETFSDLNDFLALFPDHAQALAMRDLLQEHLQKAER